MDTADIRQGPPRIIRTPSCYAGPRVCYSVIGTPYGFVHSLNGDIRTWSTRSGARSFIRRHLSNV